MRFNRKRCDVRLRRRRRKRSVERRQGRHTRRNVAPGCPRPKLPSPQQHRRQQLGVQPLRGHPKQPRCPKHSPCVRFRKNRLANWRLKDNDRPRPETPLLPLPAPPAPLAPSTVLGERLKRPHRDITTCHHSRRSNNKKLPPWRLPHLPLRRNPLAPPPLPPPRCLKRRLPGLPRLHHLPYPP